MLYLQLFERMSIIALAAYVFSQTIMFKKLFTRKIMSIEKVMLVAFFSILSIMGTYLGVKVQGGAIANIRPIGAIVAGLIGGPLVGITVGIIAGLHRYTLGGFTALSCAFSTVAEGLVGGIFKSYIKRGKSDIIISFIAGIIAEVTQVIIILLLAKPFEAAVELEKNIGLPMILINSFGVALFINIINNIKDDLNKIAAFNAYRALNIAKKSSDYLKLGLNRDSAKEICNIISAETRAKCVFICVENEVLYTTKYDEIYIKDILLNLDIDKTSELVKHNNNCFYVAKLSSEDNLKGYLGVSIKNCNDVDKYYIDFLDELAELLSIQMEIIRLNTIAQNIYKAELKALKAQIHPHFLFNALNTIASFCRTNPLKARELILSLSNYFRGTLKRNDEFVEIKDEIDLINSYIEIEKARFGDRLNFYCDIDGKIKEYKIPTFILQPIVENSIKHGISPKAVGGSVFFKGFKEDKYITFIIEDTGVGFNKDYCDSISKGEGIGITNIKERLKLYYGKNYLFEIKSALEEGTKTTIKIPIMEG